MRLWTDQRFVGGILYFERKGSGRRWRENRPSKIDCNWGKHCCCYWFGHKWQSNSIKNDTRIFERPQDYSSSDSERGFEKERVVFTFCPHSLTSEQREDRVTSCQDIIAMADVHHTNQRTPLASNFSSGNTWHYYLSRENTDCLKACKQYGIP